MSPSSQELLKRLAEEHAQRLENDIPLCRTRDEHIRVTARANEARQIVNELLREDSVEL
jgi:hypothetical protein